MEGSWFAVLNEDCLEYLLSFLTPQCLIQFYRTYHPPLPLYTSALDRIKTYNEENMHGCRLCDLRFNNETSCLVHIQLAYRARNAEEELERIKQWFRI